MSGEDITQVTLGRFRVGITGLKAAIEELKSLHGHPDEEKSSQLKGGFRAMPFT